MLKRVSLFAAAVAAVVALAVVFAQEKKDKEPEKVELPQMKFDDVKEIAPASSSATRPSRRPTRRCRSAAATTRGWCSRTTWW